MTGNHKPTKRQNRKPDNTAARIDAEMAVDIAHSVLKPSVQATITLKEYGKPYGDLNLAAMHESLTEQTKAVQDGDLKRGEAMLTAQAHTLDAIFNNLAQLAINSDYMDKLDRYLKLALRAQSQCRATWEALAAIKNPPVIGYVRQANIAHGPQQVNNEADVLDKDPCARNNSNLKNKLLEKKDGEWLDAGTTGTASHIDSEMATMGEVNRT